MIAQKIYVLKAHWRRRDAKLPFFSLGAAAYMDSGRSRAEKARYLRLARLTNPVLSQEFGPTYEKLRKKLSILLRAPVFQSNDIALPGFHIFQEQSHRLGPLGNAHFDLQYQILPKQIFQGKSIQAVASFTLPLVLPDREAGLRLWDCDYLRTQMNWNKPLKQILRTVDHRIMRYRVGHLFLHSGLIAHQPIGKTYHQKGTARITLQGHLIQIQNKWMIYW